MFPIQHPNIDYARRLRGGDVFWFDEEASQTAWLDFFGDAPASTFDLTAQDIATGAPSITMPTVGQPTSTVYNLTATNITTGAPTVSSPTLAQSGVPTTQPDYIITARRRRR
jgi:hypothetical protein